MIAGPAPGPDHIIVGVRLGYAKRALLNEGRVAPDIGVRGLAGGRDVGLQSVVAVEAVNPRAG